MVKVGDYKIRDIYPGGYSSLEPSSSLANSNYPIKSGTLGLTTDPRTANIIKDVSGKLSSGVKQIELEMISPELIDSIPKQQIEEVRRLSKLTGVDMSVHGPVIDTTGITQQGFSELNRELSERRILQTIEKSHELDPKGNIIVNFHSAEGIPGTEFKTLEGKREARRLIVVNKESGKLAPLEEETLFYPSREYKEGITKEDFSKFQKGEIPAEKIYAQTPLEQGRKRTPEWRIENLNDTEWSNSISQVLFNKERADEILQKNAPLIQGLLKIPNLDEETLRKSPTTWQARVHYENAKSYLDDTRTHLEALFHKAYKYGNPQQQEALKELSKQFQKDLEKSPGDPMVQSDALQRLIMNLKSSAFAPQMYVPVENFAVEQSSKTFGNAAFEAWNKFKDNAPVISIENPPAGFALSTGEDLRNVVEKSRAQFVENAVKSGKLSESEAWQQAEKLIGATWDVGHINMLRKQGFKEEDIIKESKKVAPFIKEVHLSDNFGFEHTELPMGMGNVPIKEIMGELGKKGFESRKIIEAAQWWQHFQTPPFQSTMELMGSPVYSDGVGPFWSQSYGLQQGYFGGMGLVLPQRNYQTFGAGFSQLPTELGGQMQGAQGSRMSNAPME